MSTPNETADQPMLATLKRGRVYFLRDREFLNGVPQAVNAEEKAWLVDNAVDYVTVEGENEHQPRAKFEFSVGTVEPVTKGPRQRTRV
jgi:hypothetical protein